MKIALIVTDKFTDQNLLENKLDELKVTEIISGTTNGFNMIQEYSKTRPNIKIDIAKGHQLRRAYNAINESDNVVIFANGDGIRTERSIANAINENKNLKIYSYKQKAFEIEKENEYVKISMSGNLKKASKQVGVFLNKEEVEKLIENLKNVIED